MSLRVWRSITLLLAALSLTMESAHVLELPQKMAYDAALYAAVNTSLYRYFAIVGAVYQVGSIVAAAVLVFLVRGRKPSFGSAADLGAVLRELLDAIETLGRRAPVEGLLAFIGYQIVAAWLP